MEAFFWTILGGFAGVLVAIVLKDKRKIVILSDITLGVMGAVLMGGLFDTFFAKSLMGLYDQTILLAVTFSGICIWAGRAWIYKHTL